MMSLSLYSRLLKYQATEERSNLENYLTEGLCDFLNRLSAKDQNEFCAVVFKMKEPSSPRRYRWETQEAIATDCGIKYPDLVGYQQGSPVVVVEVKVGAAFTTSKCKDRYGNEFQRTQLETYGHWLKDINPEGKLILLTAHTKPPDTFLAKDAECYGIAQMEVANWQGVYLFLKTRNEQLLADDYRKFLTEVGVAVDNPKRQDFFALELYLSGAHERISNVMTVVRKQLAAKYESGYRWGAEEKEQHFGFQFSPEDSMIWAWVLLGRNGYSYFHWGVFFPREEQEQDAFEKQFPCLAKRPSLYFGVATNSDEDAEALGNLSPDGWVKNEKESQNFYDYTALLAITPLEEVLSSDNFLETFFEWVDSRFAEAKEMISQIDEAG